MQSKVTIIHHQMVIMTYLKQNADNFFGGHPADY